MVCIYCGSKIENIDYYYCPHCGYKINLPDSINTKNIEHDKENRLYQVTFGQSHAFSKKIQNVFTAKNQGERGVIANIFSIHPKQELHHLLRNCEPKQFIINSDSAVIYPKPWIFTRVFLLLFFLFSLLFICTHIFSNVYTTPAYIIVGAFVLPVTIMVFLWELDLTRTISFQNLLIIMLIGGICSLFLTISIYEMTPKLSDNPIFESIFVALIEEYSKLFIICYFVIRLRIKLIINGITIGAAIGTGFGAFESAGYAYNIGAKVSSTDMLINLLDRAWLALGMHIVWCAFAGAIILYIMDGKTLTFHHFLKWKFHSLFLIPITLHAIWNIPFPNWDLYFTKFHLLIISAWIFLCIFLKKGIKQMAMSRKENIIFEDNQTLSK